MTQPSHAFFANTACRYYPCHKGIEEINCLFCFCPLYGMAHCPGTPVYIDTPAGRVKDCSGCIFPHRAENYEKMLSCLKNSRT